MGELLRMSWIYLRLPSLSVSPAFAAVAATAYFLADMSFAQADRDRLLIFS